MNNLRPIPDDPMLEKVTSAEDPQLWEKVNELIDAHNKLFSVTRQNTFSLITTDIPEVPEYSHPVGYGLSQHDLNGELFNHAMSSFKDGLSIANGGTRNQITITFNYLGVGSILLGKGSATTYTADISTSGANGLDTGSEAANTWYYVYMIAGESGGSVYDKTANSNQPFNTRKPYRAASLLSTSATPKLPPGYSRYRRVGMVRNNGSSDLYRFYDVNNWIIWNEEPTGTDFTVLSAGTATTFTAVSCAKVVPVTSTLCLVSSKQVNNSGSTLNMDYQTRPTGSNWTTGVVVGTPNILNTQTIWFPASPFPLDTSQSFDYLNSHSNFQMTFNVIGYYDPV